MKSSITASIRGVAAECSTLHEELSNVNAPVRGKRRSRPNIRSQHASFAASVIHEPFFTEESLNEFSLAHEYSALQTLCAFFVTVGEALQAVERLCLQVLQLQCPMMEGTGSEAAEFSKASVPSELSAATVGPVGFVTSSGSISFCGTRGDKDINFFNIPKFVESCFLGEETLVRFVNLAESPVTCTDTPESRIQVSSPSSIAKAVKAASNSSPNCSATESGVYSDLDSWEGLDGNPGGMDRILQDKLFCQQLPNIVGILQICRPILNNVPHSFLA
ncbi:hypothetical protein R1flu_015231 [Riccia fluitans]|uniref:Uncharacterized protein n=1 Tax=Riccia fluitans TaxID=41844 RepID=A0ABD1YIP4_9MARC